MKTQLKRLLALNLAIIMLLCAVFPASAAGTAAQPAADAQPQQTAQPTEDSTQPQTTAPNPGTHTLTINGETRTIGTGTVTGDGWEAYAFLNGDNEPLLVLALNDYKGGPIRISDPTGVGTAKQVYVLVSISGTNTVTAQSGAGILYRSDH